MFIIYMVIGFTATLACIMILTVLYFLIRQARLPSTVQAHLLARMHRSESQSTAAACFRSSGRQEGSEILIPGVPESTHLYSMPCVTAKVAVADASSAVGGQQTVNWKGLIAAWHCLPGTSTWLSTLVCALHILFRLMKYCKGPAHQDIHGEES